MDDDDPIPNINFQMPEGVEIPIKHDIPKTTLDSLVQIKNEFNSRLAEAVEKNDSSKKRRYQRQLKQFEDAIKATKEGKSFNYEELKQLVPPGFAQIPLQGGRPITMPSSSSSSQRISAPANQKPTKPETYENMNDDASDDLIDQLEKEIGDDYLDDGEVDPDEESFNQQIKAASKFIPKNILPPEPPSDKASKMMIVDPFNPKRAPQGGGPAAVKPRPQQQQQQQQQAPKQSLVMQPQAQIPSPPKARAQSKELTIILERQRLFREAALKAKQDGNTSVALVYLRHAKGFETMITAAENGLPLDMNNLPVPPQLADAMKKQKSASKLETSPNSKLKNSLSSAKISQDTVVIEDTDLEVSGDRQTAYKHLMTTLRNQVEKATENYKHFTNMGDIGNANKFNKLARESIQDLEALRNAHKLGEPLPLYHYEKKTYETIDCNSDLTDNDLEITIVRAINLTMPKDYKIDHMNTYVKFEFPYPTEEVQTDKTKVQNATCNPEYNQVFRLQIQRKQTKFVRFINRKELKLEIYIKGGFLRSDKLLTTCLVKLQPLENMSTVHDAYDLLEGRRQTGGKLEIKMRIREPILHKDVKHLECKWLIIDKFQAAVSL